MEWDPPRHSDSEETAGALIMLQVTPSEARFLQSAIPNRRAKDTIFISMFGKKAEERSENLPISGVGWLCAYPRGMNPIVGGGLLEQSDGKDEVMAMDVT